MIASSAPTRKDAQQPHQLRIRVTPDHYIRVDATSFMDSWTWLAWILLGLTIKSVRDAESTLHRFRDSDSPRGWHLVLPPAWRPDSGYRFTCSRTFSLNFAVAETNPKSRKHSLSEAGLFGALSVSPPSLRQRLVSESPRETSGSRSANRLAFQRDWTLCELLRVHQSEKDYVIVFDFHDDVLVLDSASDPKSVIFYQIKTRTSGAWTSAELVRRARGKNGKLPSVLGKLYDNYKRFAHNTTGLRLVSNVPFNVAHVSGRNGEEYASIAYLEIGDDDREKIDRGLEQEHSIKCPDAGVQLIRLQCDALSLHDHSKHALGQITDFLDKTEGCQTASAKAFYVTLHDEIGRGHTHEHLPTSFAELCKFKAICREQFEAMLTEVRQSGQRVDWPTEVINRLNAENVPFARVKSIGGAARKYCAARLDRANTALLNATRVARNAAKAAGAPPSLSAGIEAILSARRADLKPVIEIHGEDYARAIIGVALHETPELSGTAADAEDKGL